MVPKASKEKLYILGNRAVKIFLNYRVSKGIRLVQNYINILQAVDLLVNCILVSMILSSAIIHYSKNTC